MKENFQKPVPILGDSSIKHHLERFPTPFLIFFLRSINKTAKHRRRFKSRDTGSKPASSRISTGNSAASSTLARSPQEKVSFCGNGTLRIGSSRYPFLFVCVFCVCFVACCMFNNQRPVRNPDVFFKSSVVTPLQKCKYWLLHEDAWHPKLLPDFAEKLIHQHRGLDSTNNNFCRSTLKHNPPTWHPVISLGSRYTCLHLARRCYETQGLLKASHLQQEVGQSACLGKWQQGHLTYVVLTI